MLCQATTSDGMTNTSEVTRPAHLSQDSYVYHIIVALFAIICLPLLTLAKRWIEKRRLVREAAVKKYEAIEKELCSPEELFAEKLLNDEYDDALDIANRYKLDSDPVYQKQWLRENISVQSIMDLLVKIKDRHWIISECLTRIPVTLEAMTALLDMGISLTDSDYFPTINSILLNEKGEGSRDLKRLVRDDFAKFSHEEKEMVISRCQLIRFQRRLQTLQRILGGEGIAEFHFKADVYEKFREQSILQSAVNFARSGNFEAVSVLFTCHGDDTLDHWLLILSNFPEVVSPFLYQKLLPDCGISDSEVYPWETTEQQEEDWSDIFVPSDNESEEFAQILYGQAEFKELIQFKNRNLTKMLLTNWFHDRARQIEQLTNLVDNALQLVKLGIQKNLTGLMQLHQDLEIFSTVIYDCFPRVDPMPELVLDEFLLLKPSQVIDLLMIGSEKDGTLFVRCVRHFLIPYIQKIDKDFKVGDLHVYLQHFIVRTAAKNLSLITALFQSCVLEQDGQKGNEVRVIDRMEDLLGLAIEILYRDVEEGNDFLDNAFSIVECLPQRTPDSTPEINALQDRVDILEKHLAVCEASAKYSCQVFPRRLLRLQEEKKPLEVTIFFQEIINRAVKSLKVLSEAEWIQMLNDVLQIQKDCFSDVISKEQTHHLFIRCLLTHGKKDIFGLAVRLMKSLGVENCTELIVEAARDYTNSANSLTDKSIQLAKTCLQLLSPDAIERHPQVREERDFLEALDLIYNHFDLPLLPVQIRLIEQPKLDLIHRIVSHKPKAYVKSDQLLQVARLVRVCQQQDDDSRDAAVLVIAGESAMSRNDYMACLRICKKLMTLKDTSGWRLCLKLGCNDLFSSNIAKVQLLSFALMYCDADDGGKRMALMIGMVDKLKDKIQEEEIRVQQQQELPRKVLAEGANVIAGGAQAITGGAQIFTSEVSKTAHSLTTWLLPTLQTIKKDLIDKRLPVVSTSFNRSGHLERDKTTSAYDEESSKATAIASETRTNSDAGPVLIHESKETLDSEKTQSLSDVHPQRSQLSRSLKTKQPAVSQNPRLVSKPVQKVKAKAKVIDDPAEDWDDWDSQASSSATSRASSVKSVDMGHSENVRRESVKKPIVIEDDREGNWDDW